MLGRPGRIWARCSATEAGREACLGGATGWSCGHAVQRKPWKSRKAASLSVPCWHTGQRLASSSLCPSYTAESRLAEQWQGPGTLREGDIGKNRASALTRAQHSLREQTLWD